MDKTCGIYKITSPSGRVYIGQSIDILLRWRSYKNLIPSNKGQKFLYNSLVKHLPENHSFYIVEECSESELNCRERYWQDFYDVLNGGLNLVLQECGEARRVESEATRKLRSDNNKGKGNPFYGKTHSEKTVSTISEKAKLRTGEKNHFFGKSHTDESRKLMSEATSKNFEERPDLKQNLKDILSVGTYYTPEGEFISARDAAKANSTSRSSIRTRCVKHCDDKVGYNYQIPEQFRGEKTWREHGFYFIPKEE